MTDNPTLHRGAHATEWVEYLQRLLNEDAGQSLVEEDGAFGELTEQAVKDFQAKKHLTVDGVVGEQTWAALSGGAAAAPGADHHHHRPAGGPEFDLAVAGDGEYHADRDELHFPFIVAGDRPIPVANFSGWVGVQHGAHEEVMKHLALRPANGPGLAHVDSLVWGVADGFKEDFPAGRHSYRAYLPPELGGYEVRGEFTIP